MTPEILKCLAALLAGAGEAFPSTAPAALLGQLWGWTGICFHPSWKASLQKRAAPCPKIPFSSRNIPGSSHLEGSLAARERQKPPRALGGWSKGEELAAV